MKTLINEWNSVEFKFSSFKNRGEIILKEAHEIINRLEDSMLTISVLLANRFLKRLVALGKCRKSKVFELFYFCRYNAPYRSEIKDWVTKLSTTNDIIENWIKVQNLWVYLEVVFIAGDIAKQMPAVN